MAKREKVARPADVAQEAKPAMKAWAMVDAIGWDGQPRKMAYILPHTARDRRADVPECFGWNRIIPVVIADARYYKVVRKAKKARTTR
jgi:hypothetical protein